MLCRIGSSVIETSELSSVVPDEANGFLITMKNGQQLPATNHQVNGLYAVCEEAGQMAADQFRTALSEHATITAQATRHAGTEIRRGLHDVASSAFETSGRMR